jgi:hypothetical protein
LKQARRLKNIMDRRNLTGMFGTLALDVATSGVGVVASWAFCGYNMLEGASTMGTRAANLQRLVSGFPELRALLQTDDTASSSGEHGG